MKADLLVVGGGISGAGVALEAARRGLKVLLVEREDFAAGASSRSSKLVHGGLRYLKQGALHLTWQSLRAREQLLHDAPGLVLPMRFALAHPRGGRPGRASVHAGLLLYDLLAGRRTRGFADAAQMQRLMPGVRAERGASLYEDATTDDARLTLRVLQQARALGAELRNRTALLALRRDAAGQVSGAQLRGPGGFTEEVDCRCVIAAAGAWAGPLAAEATRAGLPAPRLRPLRGAHLLLPLARLNLPHALAWSHPDDGRPVFAYPWLGAALVGTTDVDHPDPAQAPRISADEQAYLLRGLAHAFPQAGLGVADIRATWAGIRPVLSTDGTRPPSQESREHLVRAHQGLVALGGGKLTTFRRMAHQALAAARPWLPALRPAGGGPLLPRCDDAGLPLALRGAFGPLAAAVQAEGAQPLGHAAATLGAVRHSLRHEQVHHLDDLLLRRTRLGLLLPGFAAGLLPALQPHCQALLGWDAARFAHEAERYLALVHDQHAPASRP